MKNENVKVISSNKKAYFDYSIFEKYVAGIVLTGTEIKSVRAGAINLKDSFIKIENFEAWLYNCHISPYDMGNRYNHEPLRVRKLLLNKKEILKILNKQKQENYTIIPLNAFLKKGYLKLEIALCKGKKLYDKRETLKKKDIARNLKNY
ncbi:TPA: SsrA-binding protein SmpB [Candidatus Galligastranaerophilus intestinigallinarum]|nr:SsrA-binding protein SmpB [Candidatus Galligastranaerophilus intestinigallinarum]